METKIESVGRLRYKIRYLSTIIYLAKQCEDGNQDRVRPEAEVYLCTHTHTHTNTHTHTHTHTHKHTH
jgi:hypothetical protein